jgi:hypothetical protein
MSKDEKGILEQIGEYILPLVVIIIIVILLYVLQAVVNILNYLNQNPFVGWVIFGVMVIIGFIYIGVKSGFIFQSGLEMDSKFLEKLPNEVQIILKEVSDGYDNHLYDSCSVMMRKALEAAISIRFKINRSENKLRDEDGEPFDLPKRIEIARQENYITRSIANGLKQLKWVGDIGAHDYRVRVNREDIKDGFKILRIALEHMFD